MATGAAYGFFVERPAVVTGYGGLQFITMEDQFKVGGVAAGTPIHVLHTGMDFGIDAAARSEVMMILRAGVAFETGLALVFRELIAIGLRLDSTGTETSTAVEHMADALLLAGVVSDYAEALTTIADALVFGTVAQSRLMNTMTDAAVFGDAVSDAMTAVEQMLDGLLIAAEPNDTATMAVLMADTLAINAAGSQSLEVHNVLRDGLDFVLRMNVDNGEYIAYTINTESRAATKYTQYPFNSFAKINGRQRGATDTGIFKMGGDTDDGEPIAARLRLGLSSLGTQIVKRMPAAYMGYSASGDLFVKVVTASTIDGEREANVYRLIVRAANTTREGRVPFGPGIKSVYYDFVIENIDENGAGGADFALDMIEFFPLLTTRRIRGDSSGKR